MGEGTPTRMSFTSSELPILLKNDIFEYTRDSYVLDRPYSPALFINSKNIENSTSNGDFEIPKVLIEVGTNYNNYLYKYRISFAKNVNFTNNNEDWWIYLFGDNYQIMDGSTNDRIILRKDFGNDNIILENNQSIKINNEVINGTYVELNSGYPVTDFVNRIEFYFAMQNPNKDYIAVGESYDNPVFKNVRYLFKSYSEQSGAEIYFGQEI